MTVFYRGPGVRITHEVIDVQCPTHQAFAIRDLSQVRVVQHAVASPVAAAVRSGSTGVAGAAAVAVGVGWPAFESHPALALATLGVLAVSVAVSGACWRVRQTQNQLVARWRGQLVVLFRSSDARTFGQVRRALLRAVELADS